MQRVASIMPLGTWQPTSACDRVLLDASERQRRRIVLCAERGTELLLDFARPVSLHDGDGLVLDDGSIVQVVGLPEPLAEITATTPGAFVSLAWHFGNRHTEVQIAGERIRIRRDHVLEEMAAGLGATIRPTAAPFDPEVGSHDDHGRHDHG
jgi:urease accessory protein